MGAKRRSVTVWDVAEMAQVSAQTVSRVLNGRGYATEETRRKVLTAVDTLGYRPNAIGKSLRMTQSPVVGLVVADVGNPFYARLHRALERELRDSGLAVFLLNCDDDPDLEARQLELLLSYRPTGLVLVPAAGSRFGEKDVAAFKNVVLVSRTLPNLSVPTVQTNESESFAIAAQELFDHGHQHIAAVLGRSSVSTTQLREAGLDAAVARNPGCHADVIYTDGSAEAGRKATTKFLRREHHKATGIVGFNGPITEGILEGIHDHGLRCPDDVSVVGFTDAGWMRATHPSITSIAQPVEEFGHLAGQLMKELVGGNAAVNKNHAVAPGVLVRRESVGFRRGESL